MISIAIPCHQVTDGLLEQPSQSLPDGSHLALIPLQTNRPRTRLKVSVEFFEDALSRRVPVDNEHNPTGLQKEILVAESGPKDLPDHFLLHGLIKVDGYDHPGQIAHLGNGQEDLPPSTFLQLRVKSIPGQS